MRASAPFSSRDTSRLSVSLRSERLLRFATCWIRSETPVQSARPSNRGSLAAIGTLRRLALPWCRLPSGCFLGALLALDRHQHFLLAGRRLARLIRFRRRRRRLAKALAQRVH